MRAASLIPAILLLSGGASAAVTEVRGHVFYEKLDPAKPSFTFQSRVDKDGSTTKVTSTYSDAQGKALLVEETELKDDHLVRYKYRQEQVGDHGDATFDGGQIKMTFTEDGKTSNDTETLDPDTIVASMIQPLLQRRWDDIIKGDTIRVRYLAIERLETIGFKFFKDAERALNGKPVVDILMKPSSFFIAALVSPVRITVTKDAPHWIVESDGRTPIRQPKRQPPQGRGDWKAIDARVEYDPPVPVPAEATTPKLKPTPAPAPAPAPAPVSR